MDERETKDTYPDNEIIQIVTEELGVELATEDWQVMGLEC